MKKGTGSGNANIVWELAPSNTSKNWPELATCRAKVLLTLRQTCSLFPVAGVVAKSKSKPISVETVKSTNCVNAETSTISYVG